MFNTEISILLNIENVQYRIFNTIEYRKKIQSRTSIIPKITFNISPHPILKIHFLHIQLRGNPYVFHKMHNYLGLPPCIEVRQGMQ